MLTARLLMVILRPTRQGLARLNAAYGDPGIQTTSMLGDWYVSVVPTLAGELFAFVSATTLLAVAIPIGEGSAIPSLVLRVANLLSMIGLRDEIIEAEVRHFGEILVAKPVNRTVQRLANDVGHHLQRFAERARNGKALSVSEAELHIAQLPMQRLAYRTPAESAFQILSAGRSVS